MQGNFFSLSLAAICSLFYPSSSSLPIILLIFIYTFERPLLETLLLTITVTCNRRYQLLVPFMLTIGYLKISVYQLLMKLYHTFNTLLHLITILFFFPPFNVFCKYTKNSAWKRGIEIERGKFLACSGMQKNNKSSNNNWLKK